MKILETRADFRNNLTKILENVSRMKIDPDEYKVRCLTVTFSLHRADTRRQFELFTATLAAARCKVTQQ